MRSLRRSLLAALLAASLLATPAAAVPAIAAPVAQSVEVEVTPARLQLYPLGTARIQLALTNPSRAEQVFTLEILLVREDGSIATAHLTEALAMAPGTTTTAIYTVRHADGAVEALVTPRPWPELDP